MRDIFVISDNILSPLGTSTAENFMRIKHGASGIAKHTNAKIADQAFCASLFCGNKINHAGKFTRFEELLVSSIQQAVKEITVDLTSRKTILIISSTKGNISLLQNEELTEDVQQRISLTVSAQKINSFFNFSNAPIVVSHACISGLVALLTAYRLLQTNVYETAIVAGADEISKFILSGFQSFQAVSSEPCKPFDAARSGITLGEGAATLILSTTSQHNSDITLCGGAISNDANHISGPSRTGEELASVIQKALKESGNSTAAIDFISAHGTATLYNDEMEAKAIYLAGLSEVPVHSLKGYYGHTLGAAGLIESAIAITSLKEDLIIPTRNYNEPGTTKKLNIPKDPLSKQLTACVKTASGFGGCNAALVFSKQKITQRA